ncbi:MAG: nicotinamide-nucleotide amidohydrolase family protein [Alphaproteobacteria bacterium]|nr:nicotinamide-nucleotide amidohydrolase family protein [Alphaproteobacteria bacterium]
MAFFPDDLLEAAEALLNACRIRSLRVTTAESCTGGLIAALLTEIPGSSDVIGHGFVTYSNDAKQDMLGVRAETLAVHGAVSSETAQEMASGALARAIPDATLAVAVTGVAGPGGGSVKKPVGTVWLAVASASGETAAKKHLFRGNRSDIRYAAVECAITMLGLAVERAG